MSLPAPFQSMLENFVLAQESRPDGEGKSKHWDVFPADYEKAITTTTAWPTFLRNALSLGFNDDLMEWDNARWTDPNSEAALKRKNHDYSPLIEGASQAPNIQKSVALQIKLLFSLCGYEFFMKFKASDVGSPVTYSVKREGADKSHSLIAVNYHDLSVLYYFYQTLRVQMAVCQTNAPLIVEIGGGFGGFMAKMKKAYPNSRCVLLDLPELSAVQSYYLHEEFPGRKFLYLSDWEEHGTAIFDQEFDFLIAPGWKIEDIPEKQADLVINSRSMMEMTHSVIAMYFENIQRITKNGGLFACFNRYIKSSAGENIALKQYPFDSYWRVLVSQSSVIQNHIHDLIVQRQSQKNIFSVREMMKTLPPF